METLLEHEAWVRGLARSLVADDSRADDVAQETWLTALREPPRASGSVRSWLGSVVRSRAIDASRSDRRRARREEVASRTEATGSAHDAAAATETHRMLVAAVMELAEPYRSSVVLRFFEGLPPREVGARTGVPAETARTRIKRGAEMLRARLDAQHEGNRGRWVALVLPIAGIGDGGGGGGGRGNGGRTAPGGKAMGTAGKAGIAAALAFVLVAGAWWALRDDGGAGDVAAAPDETPRAGTAGAARRSTGRALRPGEVAAADAKEEAAPAVVAPPVPAAEPGALVRLRFVDQNGAPLPADTVRERWGGGVAAPSLALADDRAMRGGAGRGALLQIIGGAGESLRQVPVEEGADGVRMKDRVPKGRWRLVAFPGASPSSVSLPFTIARDGDDVPVDIVLAAAPMRVVHTVDESGAPVAGATLSARFEFGDDSAFVQGLSVTTDAAGECRLPVEGADSRTHQRPPTWWATAPGRAASFQVRPASPGGTGATGATEAPFVVKLVRTCDVEGDAFLADGAPAAGRTVGWRRKGMVVEAVCDAQGKFRLAGVPSERGRLQLFLIEDVAEQRIVAGSAEAKPGATVQARIGIPAGEATGRLVLRLTAGGRPLAGSTVMCGTKESLARFGATAADGTVTLGGLATGVPLRLSVLVGDLRVSDDHKADAKDFAPFATGEERKVELDLPAGVVRVRVVDAAGAPVPGAYVGAKPKDANYTAPAGWTVRPGFAGFSDDDGVALLGALVPGASCEINAIDGVTGARATASTLPGTWDAPADVTVTLAAK